MSVSCIGSQVRDNIHGNLKMRITTTLPVMIPIEFVHPITVNGGPESLAEVVVDDGGNCKRNTTVMVSVL